ncbi:MAG: pyrroloquinoline quinone biosynthesis peptide chaperone PqqD [Gammaproteobacteria bacterium]|nr:pyrroloquinoline quinone biosynthesis peptide chaperone PqqD [Gammaproteobacteria bacterium]
MSDEMAGDTVPEITPTFRFQWEEAQQCHVILYPEGMVKLSPSAGEILKRCDGEKTIESIIRDLKTQFPDANLDADVYKFLEVAHENGWIRAK